MDDLVQWLSAQIDEDERIARAAGGLAWSRSEHPWDTAVAIRDSKGERVVCDEGWPSEGQEVHIAEHDPARVLREVEAKRQLLEPHEPTMNPSVDSDLDNLNDQSTWLPVCSACQSTIAHPGDWPCLPIRLLLAPYSDRPGYREEWRP